MLVFMNKSFLLFVSGIILLSGCGYSTSVLEQVGLDDQVSDDVLNRYDQYLDVDIQHFYQPQSEIIGIPEFYADGNPWIHGDTMLVGINSNTADVYYLSILPQFNGDWSMDPVAKIKKDEIVTIGNEPTNFQWAILQAEFPDNVEIDSYLCFLDYAISIQCIDSVDSWINGETK